MYLLSVVDNDIISCLFALQETAPPLTMNAYPEMALRSSFVLLSASAYPTTSFSHSLTLAVQSALGCCTSGGSLGLPVVDHDPVSCKRSTIFWDGLRTLIGRSYPWHL